MRIVIIGSGKVGFTLAKQLSQEGHNLVLVDTNFDVLTEAQDILDVATVCGNGADVETLKSANVDSSDLTVVCTANDEVNLLCSYFAHKLGSKHIVARVRNPEYNKQISYVQQDFGLDFIINPEKSAASEIFNLLQFPSSNKIDSFAGGLAKIVEIFIPSNSKVLDQPLNQLSKTLNESCLICAVERNDEIIIPNGDFVFEENDRVSLIAQNTRLSSIMEKFGIETPKIKKVCLIGGSKIASYLTEQLIEADVQVTIVDYEKERCLALSEEFPQAIILQAKDLTSDSLKELRLENNDAIVTITGKDEDNIVVSMYAKHINIKKIITKLNRTDSIELFNDYGLDTIVIPKLITANELIRYARAISDTREGTLETLYRIMGGHIEALGFTVPTNDEHLDTPISKLHFKPDVLLACIIRNKHVIIPGGTDTLNGNDSVIVTAKSSLGISSFSEIFDEEML